MFKNRLIISLGTLLFIAILQAIVSFWAFQNLSFQKERSLAANSMMTNIVQLRADAKRLKVWLADYIITNKRNTQMRDYLFSRLERHLTEIRATNQVMFLDSKDLSDRVFAQKVVNKVDFLSANVRALNTALSSRKKILPESDAQRWQTFISLFDQYQGYDVQRLVGDLLNIHKIHVENAELEAKSTLRFIYIVLFMVTVICVSLFLLLSHRLIKYFNQSLLELTLGAKRLAKGDFSKQIPTTGPEEFAKLAGHFNDMATELNKTQIIQQQLQQNTEQKVLERTAQLQHIVKQLNDAEKRQQGFIADISHELRTPATIILGEAELAFKESHNHHQREIFSRIVESCKTLTSRIDDLIMLSKGHHALVSVSLVETSIEKLYKIIQSEGLRYQNMHDIEYQCDSIQFDDAQTPEVFEHLTLLVDEEKIKLAISILLENAVDYQDAPKYLALSMKVRQSDVHIIIIDRGIGILQEEENDIFKRFKRGKKAMQMRPDGLGLGLSIAKQLIEAHDGNLTLSQNQDKGTTAKIQLPLFDMSKDH